MKKIKYFFILFIFLNFIMLSLQAGESSVYDFSWLDKDKQVYVLQNRKFTKKDDFYGSFLLGMSTSGAFINSYAIQGRLGYFFQEEWGAELVFSKNQFATNKNYDSVKADAGAIPFYRAVSFYMGSMLLWSPFYGKVNTFKKIVYFDWILGLGLASITDQNDRDSVVAGAERDLQSESHLGLMWETGLRFFLNEHWSLRLDFTALHYSAEKANVRSNASQLYSNFDLTMGAAYTF